MVSPQNNSVHPHTLYCKILHRLSIATGDTGDKAAIISPLLMLCLMYVAEMTDHEYRIMIPKECQVGPYIRLTLDTSCPRMAVN